MITPLPLSPLYVSLHFPNRVCGAFPTVDGRNPAPPPKLGNDDSHGKFQRTMVSTMVSKWCKMGFIFPSTAIILHGNGGRFLGVGSKLNDRRGWQTAGFGNHVSTYRSGNPFWNSVFATIHGFILHDMQVGVSSVWLKIKEEGLRRFRSMLPLTRVPFWCRFLEPPPRSWRSPSSRP